MKLYHVRNPGGGDYGKHKYFLSKEVAETYLRTAKRKDIRAKVRLYRTMLENEWLGPIGEIDIEVSDEE